MKPTRERFRAEIGDLIAIHGHRLGERERLGEILDVLGDPGHVHFRVRWDDGRETIHYPGNDATVRIHRRKREVKKP